MSLNRFKKQAMGGGGEPGQSAGRYKISTPFALVIASGDRCRQ